MIIELQSTSSLDYIQWKKANTIVLNLSLKTRVLTSLPHARQKIVSVGFRLHERIRVVTQDKRQSVNLGRFQASSPASSSTKAPKISKFQLFRCLVIVEG